MDFYYADVEQITGVQRLRLHHWMKEGFFIPSGQVAKGHGTKNTYTRQDLYKIALIKKVIESGIHGWVAGAMLDILRVDFNLMLSWHQRQKSEHLPSLLLCIMLRFSEGKVVETELLDNAGDLFADWGPSLGEGMSTRFQEKKYDQAIVINFGKLIDDIDSRI